MFPGSRGLSRQGKNERKERDFLCLVVRDLCWQGIFDGDGILDYTARETHNRLGMSSPQLLLAKSSKWRPERSKETTRGVSAQKNRRKAQKLHYN